MFSCLAYQLTSTLYLLTLHETHTHRILARILPIDDSREKVRFSIVATTLLAATASAQAGILISLAGQLTSAVGVPSFAITSIKSGLVPSIISATVTTTFAATTSATSRSTPTGPISNTTQDSGLSTGAKAGIGVGTALGFIILAALTNFFFPRRRKRGQHIPHPDSPQVSDETAWHKRYIGGEWRAEAEVKDAPVEIDSKNVQVVPGGPVELEAPR
jgi:hypothetical protein